MPHNHYQARDGSWIAIACTNDRMFERLAVDAMGQPRLPAEFASMDERIRRRDELDARVQAWIGSLDAAEALARLDAADVPCSRVNSVRDIFEDEHMRARPAHSRHSDVRAGDLSPERLTSKSMEDMTRAFLSHGRCA